MTAGAQFSVAPAVADSWKVGGVGIGVRVGHWDMDLVLLWALGWN